MPRTKTSAARRQAAVLSPPLREKLPRVRWSAIRLPLLGAAVILVFTAFVYANIVTTDGFGAEFPLYWVYGHGLEFPSVKAAFGYYATGWYRPLSTTVIAWIGEMFLDWHNLVGWKIFNLTSLVAAAGCVYWFVLVFAPRARLAAFFAALYYLAHPANATLPIQMLPFDTLYLIFSILCGGLYWRSIQRSDKSTWVFAAGALVCFALALTAKENAASVPGFLFCESVAALYGERHRPGLWRRVRIEALRLAPFAAMLLVYWAIHLRALTVSFGATGLYRTGTDWQAILINLRTLPLMVMRIFYLAAANLDIRSYLETTFSTITGFVILLIVVAGWFVILRTRREYLLAGLLFLAWVAVTIALPVYSGGSVWHITMPVCGYGALFGLAAAALISLVPKPAMRWGIAAAAMGGLAMAGQASINDEFYNGLFTLPYNLTRDLLRHPPVAPSDMPPGAIIFMEDSMGLGGWSYGCYGHLMRFVYEQADLKERILPVGNFPVDVRNILMGTQRAYLFTYDSDFHWHDATPNFRGGLQVLPGHLDLRGSDPVRFQALNIDGVPVRVTWTATPALGTFDEDGTYHPPALMTDPSAKGLAIVPPIVAASGAEPVSFQAWRPQKAMVHIKGALSGSPYWGAADLSLPLGTPQHNVTWSVEPADAGSIDAKGVFRPRPGQQSRMILIRAQQGSEVATARVASGASWLVSDIGAVAREGSYANAGESIRMAGSGEIAGSKDTFRYAFQPLDFDGSITARVDTAQTRDITVAGLMMRESLSDGAPHATAAIESGRAAMLAARSQPSSGTSHDAGPSSCAWLRLERQQDQFSAFCSPNGQTWTKYASKRIPMARRIFAGVAIAGRRSPAEATFSSVRGTVYIAARGRNSGSIRFGWNN